MTEHELAVHMGQVCNDMVYRFYQDAMQTGSMVGIPPAATTVAMFFLVVRNLNSLSKPETVQMLLALADIAEGTPDTGDVLGKAAIRIQQIANQMGKATLQ